MLMFMYNKHHKEDSTMEPQQTSTSTQSPAVNSPVLAPTVNESTTPNTWPGAFGVYKTSKAAVMLNIGTVVCLILASIGISVLFDIFFKDDVSFIGDIISFIVSTLFSVATILTYLACVRGQKLGLGDSIRKSVPFWIAMILLSILSALILAFSLILLIVPFFFVFPRIALAPYYLIDQKQGVVEALKSSWEKSKGNVGKIYGIFGANIAMALLMVTIIGIPFAIYFLVMYSAATALLFNFLNKQASSPSAPLV